MGVFRYGDRFLSVDRLEQAGFFCNNSPCIIMVRSSFSANKKSHGLNKPWDRWLFSTLLRRLQFP
jgi:hypothetical protein